MNKPTVYACLGVALYGLAIPAHSDVEENLSRLTEGGSSSFALRYRYELVDQDGIDRKAQASTLRVRYTWTSAPAEQETSGELGPVHLGLETDYVSVVGAERYNSTHNGNTRYPVVADPEGFDLNQAFIAYQAGPLSATGGRQRILLDGQRFVGGVGWRQNEQTFDGVRLHFESAERFGVDYAYVTNVNRIFGPEDGAQPADWRSNSHLLTAHLTVSPAVKVGAFGYLMDFENDNGVPNSNATFGVEGTARLGPVLVSASAARQTDYADSPLNYRASYLMLDAAFAVHAATVNAGIEILGSDGGAAAFRTPLATLHKFQGWADQFLNTPNAGVRDLYGGVKGALGPLQLQAVYHDFSPDQGGGDYGTELDLAVSASVWRNGQVQIKYADYHADRFASDTVKAWLTLSYAF